MIFLGAENPNEEPVQVVFNSRRLVRELPAVTDLEGNIVREEKPYYPVIDVTVNAGEGVVKGKRATLEVLDKLVATPVTQENWKLLAAELEILQIPQKTEIVEDWERRFSSPVPEEVVQALGQNPELLNLVQQMLGTDRSEPPDTAAGPMAGTMPVV